METCGTTQVAHPWSQTCFFLFLIRARLFPTPSSLALGILFAWKARLMAKVSKKCFLLRRAFLYNSCLKKLLLSSCSEYYFAFFLILCFLLSLLIYLLSYSWSRFPPLGCTLHSRSDFILFHLLLFMWLLR